MELGRVKSCFVILPVVESKEACTVCLCGARRQFTYDG